MLPFPPVLVERGGRLSLTSVQPGDRLKNCLRSCLRIMCVGIRVMENFDPKG